MLFQRSASIGLQHRNRHVWRQFLDSHCVKTQRVEKFWLWDFNNWVEQLELLLALSVDVNGVCVGKDTWYEEFLYQMWNINSTAIKNYPWKVPLQAMSIFLANGLDPNHDMLDTTTWGMFLRTLAKIGSAPHFPWDEGFNYQVIQLFLRYGADPLCTFSARGLSIPVADGGCAGGVTNYLARKVSDLVELGFTGYAQVDLLGVLEKKKEQILCHDQGIRPGKSPQRAYQGDQRSSLIYRGGSRSVAGPKPQNKSPKRRRDHYHDQEDHGYMKRLKSGGITPVFPALRYTSITFDGKRR